MVQGSNTAGGEIFRTHLHQSPDPPSLLYNGHQVSFPGVKQPVWGTDHHDETLTKAWKHAAMPEVAWVNITVAGPAVFISP